MSEKKSMREEIDELARRLAEREVELDQLEEQLARIETDETGAELTRIEVEPAADAPAIVIEAPRPIISRDPAVVELLRQSGAAAVRFDHLRASVENLDRKVDALARALLDQRRRDEDERRQEIQGASRRRDHLLRLAIMAVVLLVIALVWALV
ncbi:MAG: hypothetical protein H6807_16335 [Planctomycetes bacterium]|nr:hypothetical protein [Planctomycetota bacterium]